MVPLRNRPAQVWIVMQHCTLQQTIGNIFTRVSPTRQIPFLMAIREFPAIQGHLAFIILPHSPFCLSGGFYNFQGQGKSATPKSVRYLCTLESSEACVSLSPNTNMHHSWCMYIIFEIRVLTQYVAPHHRRTPSLLQRGEYPCYAASKVCKCSDCAQLSCAACLQTQQKCYGQQFNNCCAFNCSLNASVN